MKSRYHSFLVRMWASETGDELAWRVSLENTKTGEKHIFANLNDLLAFFENLIGAPSVSRGNTEGKASKN